MKMGWVVYFLLAACSFTCMILLYKKMLLLGMNQNILNWAVFGMVFLGFSALIVVQRTSPKLSLVLILLLLLTAALSFAGNYLQVKAFSEAPNPGFASTLIAVQLIMISVHSSLLL